MQRFLSIEALTQTDYSVPAYFLAGLGVFFTVVFLRYVLFSGIFYGTNLRLFHKKNSRLVNHYIPTHKQIFKEAGWSALTSLIFALTGMICILLWQHGFITIVADWSVYGWWYLPLSLAVVLFIHETYYYWAHRWMHIPSVFRFFHKVHHDSHKTTAWTAFSFHPLESLLQAFIIPVILVFVPLHFSVLALWLVIMTFSGTLNHASIEVFPARFNQNALGKWMIGSTHHDLHHKQYRFNYGLYFTFWDRWMGTENPDFDKKFEAHTEKTRS